MRQIVKADRDVPVLLEVSKLFVEGIGGNDILAHSLEVRGPVGADTVKDKNGHIGSVLLRQLFLSSVAEDSCSDEEPEENHDLEFRFGSSDGAPAHDMNS